MYFESYKAMMWMIAKVGSTLGSTLLLVMVGRKLMKLVKIIAPKALTKAFLMYSRSRAAYRWNLRPKTPRFTGLTHLGDYVFHLDKETAGIDSPRSLPESIKVLSATFKKHDMCTDVADKVNSCLRGLEGSSGNVVLYLNDFIQGPTCGNEECSLEVLYIGHADPTKQIQAGQFGVKYSARACSSIVFPPYKVTEKIKRGLTANKVVHARTFHEKNLTPLAIKYAGLRANFYRDVADPQVLKDHIDHKEVHVLLSEKGKAPHTIVATRKAV